MRDVSSLLLPSNPPLSPFKLRERLEHSISNSQFGPAGTGTTFMFTTLGISAHGNGLQLSALEYVHRLESRPWRLSEP